MNTFPFENKATLQALNTFAIDVKARQLLRVTNQTTIDQLIRWRQHTSDPLLILGGGSNLLFTQNYPGLVAKVELPGIECVKQNKDVLVTAGAGENWHQLVCYCVEQQLHGIENLSLIPGTVGAAPIQNIGAYGVELKDVFVSLSAIELSSGKTQVFSAADCNFSYRNSVFKHELADRFLISSVTLKLSQTANFNLNYGAIKETLSSMNIKKPSLSAVAAAVCHIRRNKLPDPAKLGNAGSFFKNPLISHEQLSCLQQQYPSIPYFAYSKHQVKIAAGWLIEQCGWKGKRFAEYGVHTQQALVLINYGGASGANIDALAKDIQHSVAEKFEIELEPEVKIL